jgi:hypothetical protein
MSITKSEEIGTDTGEYAKWVMVKGNFVTKARVFNTALPAVDSDLIGADISPINSPSFIRIYCAFSVSGVLSIARTVGAVTIDEQMNGGVALVANAAYMFTIPWRTGDYINVEYSVTGGTTLILDVVEVRGVE